MAQFRIILVPPAVPEGHTVEVWADTPEDASTIADSIRRRMWGHEGDILAQRVQEPRK